MDTLRFTTRLRIVRFDRFLFHLKLKSCQQNFIYLCGGSMLRLFVFCFLFSFFFLFTLKELLTFFSLFISILPSSNSLVKYIRNTTKWICFFSISLSLLLYYHNRKFGCYFASHRTHTHRHSHTQIIFYEYTLD